MGGAVAGQIWLPTYRGENPPVPKGWHFHRCLPGGYPLPPALPGGGSLALIGRLTPTQTPPPRPLVPSSISKAPAAAAGPAATAPSGSRPGATGEEGWGGYTK